MKSFTSFQKKIITVALGALLLVAATYLDDPQAKAGLFWLAGMLKGGAMFKRPGDDAVDI